MFKQITKTVDLETKSYQANDLSLLMLGIYGDQNKVDLNRFISYYYKSSPLFTAVKLIADNINNIDFVLKDNNKEEFIYQHKILQLIKKPNPFTGKNLFMESIINNFLLTGDAFIEVIGNNQPVELNIIPSQHVTIIASPRDGYPESYNYNGFNSSNRTFTRRNNRFFADNGNELINLRSFNPEYSANNLRGVSYIQPIELEITQYILASLHNESTIKNQGRPSGILTYKGNDGVPADTQAAVKENLQKTFSGAKNSGNTMFLGGDFDFKQMSESIKDMDFATLKVQTQVAIYNALKIPLPMISPDHMSLANMDTAKLNFYDNCIIPLFTKIANFLNENLLSRYKNSDNLQLTYDEAAIAALKPRLTENTERMANSGVLTINELRSLVGREDLTEGGDRVYQPMNLVPVGQDQYIRDNREKPAKKSMQEDFINALMKQGKHSLEEIKQLSLEYGNSEI